VFAVLSHALGYLNLAPHEIMNNYFSIENARGFHHALGYLSGNVCKSGPLHFGSEKSFLSNFAQETILGHE